MALNFSRQTSATTFQLKTGYNRPDRSILTFQIYLVQIFKLSLPTGEAAEMPI